MWKNQFAGSGLKVKHQPTYHQYRSMKDRCCNPNNKDYQRYGGRGINICNEWLNDPEAYINWAYDNGWRPWLQIDRIDNSKGYSPENCRFVTIKENLRNRRVTRYLTVNGNRQCVSYWEEKFGIDRHTIYFWMDNYGDDYAASRLEEHDFPVYKKEVICVETGEQFESANAAMKEKFGGSDGSSIAAVCRGSKPAYKGLHFRYAES